MTVEIDLRKGGLALAWLTSAALFATGLTLDEWRIADGGVMCALAAVCLTVWVARLSSGQVRDIAGEVAGDVAASERIKIETMSRQIARVIAQECEIPRLKDRPATVVSQLNPQR